MPREASESNTARPVCGGCRAAVDPPNIRRTELGVKTDYHRYEESRKLPYFYAACVVVKNFCNYFVGLVRSLEQQELGETPY